MGKKKKSETMEQFLAGIEAHINVEPHLDPELVEEEGFFRKAVTTAGLWKFVTATPSKIFAKAVAELLLNLREGQNLSSFTDPENGEPVEVDLSDLIGVFNLPEIGADSLLKTGLSPSVEYGRFAVENAEEDVKKASIRNDLKAPFNYICELFSKSIACYVGNLGQLSEVKALATSVIIDSLTGGRFNWHGWFLNQIRELAKDFAFVRGSTDQILRKGKLKFFARLSVALEEKYPGKVWPKSEVADYKKSSIFYDQWRSDKKLIDEGLINVVVPEARPVVERQAEVSQVKRVASPGKRAAPKRGKKKMKRVVSLVQESEAEEQPLEDVEVTQPQSSPIKIQTPPPQVQIQTLQTQTQPLPETQTSSTAQHQSQKSPLSPLEEETGSSFQIPSIPPLHVDPVEAYTTFQPIQTQPPPTEAIEIS